MNATRNGLFALALLAMAVVFAATLLAAPGDAPASGEIPAPIPESAKRVPNPVPATPESIGHGQVIYSSQCTMCHGAQGRGDGDFAPRMGVPVPDLTDAERMAARTDGELFYILSKGHGRMAENESRLSEERRWDLVNLLRSMAAPAE